MNVLECKDLCNILGRHTWQGKVLYLGFSASYIEFCFYGTKLDISLITDFYQDKDGKVDIYYATLAIFINDMDQPKERIVLKEKEINKTLFESSVPQKVTIRIMKYSEAAFSKVGITNLELAGELLTPPARKHRKIEYIGDSITCGYGVEGIADKDVFTTLQENPMLSYSCQSAILLNAEFQLVSWSGIGIITNYVDETVNEPFLDRFIMPELYKYTDGELERSLHKTELEVWDNKRFVPDLIIINIGTNDASYTRGIKDRQEFFAREYLKFLQTVRTLNPDSYILCMLGSMGQELCTEEENQVEYLKSLGDKKIEYIRLPVQDNADGIGVDSHPSKITHKKVAYLIKDYCEKWINW